MKAEDVADEVDKTFLEQWRRNAGEGVMLFGDADLNDAIRNQHFDDTSWFRALVGNLTWAAACFTTGGTAFAISVAGILLGVPPFNTNQTDTTLLTIEKRMLNHLDGLRISLKRQLRSVSAKEVAKPDVTTKEQAVERVLRVLFRPEFLIPPKPDPWGGDPVELNGTAIRDVYQEEATRHLKQYREQIAPIKWGQAPDVAMVIQVSGAGLVLARWSDEHWQFIRWIDPEMRDEAARVGAEHWKRWGGWWTEDNEWVRWDPAHPLPEVQAAALFAPGLYQWYDVPIAGLGL